MFASRFASILRPALLAAALLYPGQAGAVEPAPRRIVSTNVCTDQLLLTLVDRSRIAALSNLAGDPNLSSMPDAARGIPQTGGRAEEIVPLQPDLVLANAWTGAKASRFLKGLGIKVLIVPEAQSLDEIAAVITDLGTALRVPERAAAVVSSMTKRLSRAARPKADRLALIYEPNGYTPSTGTLSDSVLATAGWTNLAPRLGVASYGAVPLERVIMTQPGLLIFDDHAPSNASRAQGILHHPSLRTVARRAQVAWMPSRLWICAGPWTVEAVERLAKIERRP
jgi:iron complex transport system substrate-binding protein